GGHLLSVPRLLGLLGSPCGLGRNAVECHGAHMRIVHSMKKRPRRRTSAGGPGDYFTELVRLCRGNRGKAERLIQEELARSPNLTPAGAALAVVTRIRHERDPHVSRL